MSMFGGMDSKFEVMGVFFTQKKVFKGKHVREAALFKSGSVTEVEVIGEW